MMGHAEVSAFEIDLLGILSLYHDSEFILKLFSYEFNPYELCASSLVGTNSLCNIIKYYKIMNQKYVIMQDRSKE